ncbi:hypothetical protein ABZ137_36585 [Streptomyces bobili]|uniref:hypothetical protein n=1 Tax=Streptomyces bobili TaxID=67280 RepID=UPI0033AA5306
MAQIHIGRLDGQPVGVDDGVRHPIRARNPHPLHSHSSPPCVDDTTGPGVRDGHPALSTSTTKTSTTARDELFINWPWRGWILIHAGLNLEQPALRDPLVATAIRGRELPLGAVIGVARLTGCHPDQGSEKCTSPWAQRGGHWAQRGGHHLVFADVQALALPVPATGALPAWKPTQDLVDRVFQQLPHLRL